MKDTQCDQTEITLIKENAPAVTRRSSLNLSIRAFKTQLLTMKDISVVP